MIFTGTKNFLPAEVACKCGCGMLPEQDFMERVQRLRDRIGFPLKVSSAARCPMRNAAVSSTGLDGPHTTGRAIDLDVEGALAYRVVQVAPELGFTGIGVNQKGNGRFVHLDDLWPMPKRPRPWIWSY